MPESSKLEFLEKFLANSFGLSDAEDNISRSLNRGDIADLSFLEKTIRNLPKVLRVTFLGRDKLETKIE